MTLSEVPLATLNRYAAERIEPKRSHSAASVWQHSFRTGEYLPIDFTQPFGMKMLLERMVKKYGLSVAFEKISKQYAPMAVYDLPRAILEAFVISEGFQVEEA